MAVRSKWRNYRGVSRPVGMVVMGLAAAIGLCAVVGALFNALEPSDNPVHAGGEDALAIAGALALGIGFVLFRYGAKYADQTVTRREAVLSVALIWVAAGFLGALPFMFGAQMSFTEALFESVSGLTTTGATVLVDIEGRLSRPLLLWRSLIQWLGGMGIVVLFVAVFPNIGAGGKHMFGKEVPGTSAEGLKPRIAETSRVLWYLYFLFTAVEVGVLYALDMSLFESLCHAFTTMSTGGFSTRNASLGAWNSWQIEMVVAGFMLLGSVNYGLYYVALRNRSIKGILRSVEFRAFVVIVSGSVLVLTFGLLEVHEDIGEAFRYSFFMVATTVSSTGFGTDDYTKYPPEMLMIVLILMFVGGCAGSTAGGIKIERIVLMAKISWTEVRRSFRPSLVHVVRMGKTVVTQSALTEVAVFFMVYMLVLGTGTVIITTLEGVSIPTAFGAMLTSLSNMGPGPFHELANLSEIFASPDRFQSLTAVSDNFASYSGASKLVFVVAMLLGRLEFFALLALLVPDFWRR